METASQKLLVGVLACAVMASSCTQSAATREELAATRTWGADDTHEESLGSGEEPTAPSPLLISILAPATSDDIRARATDVPRTLGPEGQQARMDECVRAAGFDVSFVSNRPPDLVPRYGDFPDLASIERYGLSPSRREFDSEWARLTKSSLDPSTNPAGSGFSDAEWSALLDEVGRCDAATSDQDSLAAFEAEHSALIDLWYQRMRSDAVDTSDDVLRAQRGFAACAEEHGFSVDDEFNYLSQTTGLMAGADTETEFQEIHERASNVYVECMRPVLAVREPLRLKAQDQFVQEHMAALIEAERDLRRLLDRASA